MSRAAAIVFTLAAAAPLLMGCHGSRPPREPEPLSCEVAPSDTACIACLKTSCCAEARAAETSISGAASKAVTRCGVDHCSAQCRWRAE